MEFLIGTGVEALRAGKRLIRGGNLLVGVDRWGRFLGDSNLSSHKSLCGKGQQSDVRKRVRPEEVLILAL